MESQKKFYLECPIKVNTYDTDYMGIVSNTVYPKYFENLRNEILDKYFPLEEMLKEKNTPILAETHIWYKRPLTLESRPIGKINVTLSGASRWEAEIEIVEGERIYCKGHQVGYYFNLERNKPVRFPKEFLEKYESI
ncbi:MAG: acyl-CoA thioesterase [Bacteroidaceae bacterium]|jgi:acyl-CoA thioester hydrolase|nr:acyl-CoA thioesterase [Bacteroidaceae bacterium]